MKSYGKRERAGKKHQLKKGLAPIIDKDTKVLILGSFPGDDSLKCGEYYAHSKNKIWQILSASLNEKDLDRACYRKKKEFLRRKGIGLWDVIMSCEREGTSDNKIRNAKLNDFNRLFKKYPKIKVFCNGKTAYSLLSDCHAEMDSVCLPSSSMANTHKSLAEKKKMWEIMKKHL